MIQSVCRHCGDPVAYGPYWGDKRQLDPPVWHHDYGTSRTVACRGTLTSTRADPVPLTHAEVPRPRDLFRVIDDVFALVQRERRILLCSPEDEERVRAALDAMPHESGAGLFDLQSSPYVPRDRVFVFNPSMVTFNPKEPDIVSYSHFSTDCAEHHDLVRDFGGPTPPIVVLCGSTRFYDAFQQANYDLTMAGSIVLSVGFYPHATTEHGHGEGVGHDSDDKIALDELHRRKIDLADRVMVLNVGGYIGESTRSEIKYAERLGKPIVYLEEAEPVAKAVGDPGAGMAEKVTAAQAGEKAREEYGDALAELGDR